MLRIHPRYLSRPKRGKKIGLKPPKREKKNIPRACSKSWTKEIPKFQSKVDLLNHWIREGGQPFCMRVLPLNIVNSLLIGPKRRSAISAASLESRGQYWTNSLQLEWIAKCFRANIITLVYMSSLERPFSKAQTAPRLSTIRTTVLLANWEILWYQGAIRPMASNNVVFLPKYLLTPSQCLRNIIGHKAWPTGSHELLIFPRLQHLHQ